MRRTLAPGLITALLLLLCLAPGARADGVTNLGDDARTGWYPDQPALGRADVGAADFGQLFATRITGQVYAQPLVSNGTLLVATEENWLYGMDPATGAIRWQRRLGPAFDATAAPISCSDLTPHVGVTATPVIDPANGGTAYVTSKRGPGDAAFAAGAYVMHAVDLQTGNERPGFPVELKGPADDDPGLAFDPKVELQRPGLLLMGGVVYAAFGGHCDYGDYRGWVFGVSQAGSITTRWATEPQANHGAGIWQAGTGLATDGAGSLFVVTGNAYGPTGSPSGNPVPGSAPPRGLGESVVRLRVGSDGRLRPGDFFAPGFATLLDDYDSDFASGGPVVLPSGFGTAAAPATLAIAGKQGTVYTLDRSNLGGFRQGPAGGDAYVHATPQRGSVFGHPSVWPGGGGWAYVPTSGAWGGATASGIDFYRRTVDATTGLPQLTLCASTPAGDPIGIGTSSSVITSDGLTPGSAVMWAVTMPFRDGVGAQLRAYDPEPACGSKPAPLRAFAVGKGTKYGVPGIGDGRVYVGTLDGKLLGYGRPSTTPLTASGGALGDATVGTPLTKDVVLTVQQPGLTITSIGLDAGSAFTLGAPSPGLPAAPGNGGTLRIPVTYAPSQPGLAGSTLHVQTSAGELLVSLSARARAAGGYLQTSPSLISLGGVRVGTTAQGTATFTNAGAQPLHITSVAAPAAPATISGLPAAPFTLQPDDSITATVRFPATSPGDYASELHLETDGSEPVGNRTVGITATAQIPGHLEITPSAGLDLGAVVTGQTAAGTLTLTNTGTAALTLTKSKKPAGGPFTVGAPSIDEGSVLQGGATVAVPVTFTPTAAGAASQSWALTADDGAGAHTITLTGTGLTPGRLAVPATPLDLGRVALGQSASTTLAVRNTGQAPVRLTTVGAAGAGFSVTGAQAGDAIAPGATSTLTVAFAPASSGAQTGTLTVAGDDGQGARAVALSGRGFGPGRLVLGATAVDFGAIAPGTQAVRTVTVRNPGESAVRITALEVPGAPYAMTGAAVGDVLAPGASVTLTVSFAPAAAGAFSGTLTVTGDDGLGPQRVALGGAGLPPEPPAQAAVPPAGDAPAPPAEPGAAPAFAPAPLAALLTTAPSLTPLATLPSRLTGLRLTPARFRTRTTLRFHLTGRARVRVTVRRATGSRAAIGGALVLDARAGWTSVAFSGPGRALAAGRYLLAATPAGGRAARVAFTVAPPPAARGRTAHAPAARGRSSAAAPRPAAGRAA